MPTNPIDPQAGVPFLDPSRVLWQIKDPPSGALLTEVARG